MSALSEAELSASGRRLAMRLIGFGLMMPLAACGQEGKKMQKEIVLNVEVISYVDRGIANIIFNGTGLGVMGRYGGTGTITGVRIPFGVQALKWTLDGPKGTARNGEVVTVKNELVISPSQIPAGTRYLGLHIYPDDTAEITFSEFIPETTARGEKILATRKIS